MARPPILYGPFSDEPTKPDETDRLLTLANTYLEEFEFSDPARYEAENATLETLEARSNLNVASLTAWLTERGVKID